MECFVGSSVSVGNVCGFVKRSAVCTSKGYARPRTTYQRSVVIRAQAGEEEEETVVLVKLSDEEQKEKDEIMAQLEEQVAPKTFAPNNRNLGATRDADGKSNIWAVEPRVNLEDEESGNEKKVFVFIAVSLVLAGIAVLPKLPLISPDAY